MALKDFDEIAGVVPPSSASAGGPRVGPGGVEYDLSVAKEAVNPPPSRSDGRSRNMDKVRGAVSCAPESYQSPSFGQLLGSFFNRAKAPVSTNSTTKKELVGQRIDLVKKEVAIEVDATLWGRWVNEPSGRIVAGALLGWGLRRWIPYLANAGFFSVASGVFIAAALLTKGHLIMRPAIANRLGVIILTASVALQVSPPRPNFAIPPWLQQVLYGKVESQEKIAVLPPTTIDVDVLRG